MFETPEPVRVWKGKENFLRTFPAEPLPFTAPLERGEHLNLKVAYTDPLIAPIPRGAAVGTLIIGDDIGELRRIPLAAAEDIERGGFFKRLIDGLRLFFRGLFQGR